MSSFTKLTGQVGATGFSDVTDARAPALRGYQYSHSSPTLSSSSLPHCMTYWTKCFAERALAYRMA
ncbi:hypothetical protein P691DRAFT_806541, partial [Macrolepiota fuliginosa MF-IS2]